MSMEELVSLIGTPVFLEPIRGLFIRCRVTNVKTAYGHQRVEIAPLSGEGRAWVSLAAIQDASFAGSSQNQEVRNGDRS